MCMWSYLLGQFYPCYSTWMIFTRFTIVFIIVEVIVIIPGCVEYNSYKDHPIPCYSVISICPMPASESTNVTMFSVFMVLFSMQTSCLSRSHPLKSALVKNAGFVNQQFMMDFACKEVKNWTETFKVIAKHTYKLNLVTHTFISIEAPL